MNRDAESEASSLSSDAGGHRWFAAMFDCIAPCVERRFRPYRSRVVGAATGRVLEIGAGTGANFPHYGAAESVVATDPDPFMLRRAQRRASGLALDIEIRQCPAEDLPFPDESFDTVISTLTLCTVGDQAAALAEIKRVLRPGGTLGFVEHVRANGRLHVCVQDALTPAWRWFGAGCHPNRDTGAGIKAAGLRITELERRAAPLVPLIAGAARPVN